MILDSRGILPITMLHCCPVTLLHYYTWRLKHLITILFNTTLLFLTSTIQCNAETETLLHIQKVLGFGIV